MSDDLDFDMEVVGDDDLDELGSDDASSLDDERRLVEAQSGETTAESTDPRRKRVKDNRSGSSSPESDLDDVESFPSEVDPFRFGDVPADWSVSLVGEIANGEKGLVDGDWVESKDMDEDGNIQLVQLGHIGEGQFKGQPNRFVNREFAKEEDCTILSEGDLLISRMQEPILRSCLLPDFECDSIMAVDIARLRENDDWNRICLKYLFNSRPIWKQGIAWASGTTRKRISRKNIEKIRLQKPPLPEQRKIASVLYAVDQAIQKTEEVIEQAKRVKQGLMQRLFHHGLEETNDYQTTKYGSAPAHWEIKPISDLAIQVQAGGTPDTDREEFYDGKIPWIRTGELRQKRIRDPEKSITEAGFENSTARLFPKNTVLVAMYGATAGESAMLDIEATSNQACCGVITDEEKILPEFLFQQLLYLKENLIALGAGSGQQNISKGIISNFRVLVPQLEEQTEIASMLRIWDEEVEAGEKKREQLKRLKKGLMQDLLTGEVRTADKAIEVLGEVKAHG
ncbi:restriction endonuclease subunit S [Salinibacter ruber]|uniref:restriction endonuclease subunit S n=1 Tax=Salinibacter ruber TaxID=146919 RepID=UPI002167C040|nr:restriction endonuclease subunit S [Salinibacter ruber]MCS4133527.1 type I restriction enzyme S subunit [Salinibacter ruber]